MYLVGARGQQQIDVYYDYSGSITAGGTAQLMLPQRKSCSQLVLANTSASLLMIQFGVGRAVATLTNGSVSAVTVNDAGFGFLFPPEVFFLGGGNSNDPQSFGGTMPDWPPPSNAAVGRAIMSAGAISSIEIDNAGSGYLAAPYVMVQASRRDPTGVGLASATAGIPLAAGAIYKVDATSCPTSAISVWGATTGQTYTAKWMP